MYFSGLPEVVLNEGPSAVLNECVEFKATIRSFPKHHSVLWKKDDDPIDITLPKYKGSSDVGDCPLLCINNIKEEDEAAYTIEVQNECGKGIDTEKLKVIGGKNKPQYHVRFHEKKARVSVSNRNLSIVCRCCRRCNCKLITFSSSQEQMS